jgi:hypothetical protein
MPLPKPLSKEQILAAMSQTLSNRSAARYLNVSYQHYKKWAKLYEATKEGYPSLFEQHLNQQGLGIAKYLKNSKKQPALLDIIEGRVPMTSHTPEKMKKRLIEEGFLNEECYNCGFHERRLLDYKVPIILHFKDNNKKNYRIENLEFLCYNCYYLTIGDIFTGKDLTQLEDHKPVSNTTEAINFEMDDYTLQRMKELGLYDPPKSDSDDDYDLVSRL